MTGAVANIVGALAETEFEDCRSGCGQALESAILTDASQINETTRERLELIAGRYFSRRD
jgi:hypothetical protein